MEWLLRSDFDVATTVALWSIAGVSVTTIVLFGYTMGLRIVTIRADSRRQRFLAEWRDIFASSALSASAAETCALPTIRAGSRIDLLEEWNLARSIVSGDAAGHLMVLARRAGIPEVATQLLQRQRMRSKILAVQTLGHLRDKTHRDPICDLVQHDNTALSITAAVALAEIDPAFAVNVLIPLIPVRRDWPKNRVSLLLRFLGSELISEPMYRTIRAADDDAKTYLLQFARLVEAEVLDALVVELIRDSSDPGVLSAALKLVSGFEGVPRIATLTHHPVWFVRMQAAKVLGRVGQQEHLALLEALLCDREWWVRYRAAQAVASLPFLGPNQLRRMQRESKDPFAADILQQAFAEVGLA